MWNNTFVDGFRGGFHGLDGEGKERELVARDGVTDFLHDFGDGDELVGDAVNPFAGFDDGISVDDGNGDAIVVVIISLQQWTGMQLQGFLWRSLLLHHAAPA